MAHKFKDAEGEWEDCTEQFTTACGSLAPGELCADPAFSLRVSAHTHAHTSGAARLTPPAQQSIAAIELMDPKMDAGMELYRHHADIASAEDAFAKGLKRGGHTPEEVVGPSAPWRRERRCGAPLRRALTQTRFSADGRGVCADCGVAGGSA